MSSLYQVVRTSIRSRPGEGSCHPVVRTSSRSRPGEGSCVILVPGSKN